MYREVIVEGSRGCAESGQRVAAGDSTQRRVGVAAREQEHAIATHGGAESGKGGLGSEPMRSSSTLGDDEAEAKPLPGEAEGRISAAASGQKVMLKSTDFLRRIIAAVGGLGGSHCRTCALIATATRLKITPGGFGGRRE